MNGPERLAHTGAVYTFSRARRLKRAKVALVVVAVVAIVVIVLAR